LRQLSGSAWTISFECPGAAVAIGLALLHHQLNSLSFLQHADVGKRVPSTATISATLPASIQVFLGFAMYLLRTAPMSMRYNATSNLRAKNCAAKVFPVPLGP
jgi:hypothetical protein